MKGMHHRGRKTDKRKNPRRRKAYHGRSGEPRGVRTNKRLKMPDGIVVNASFEKDGQGRVIHSSIRLRVGAGLVRASTKRNRQILQELKRLGAEI